MAWRVGVVGFAHEANAFADPITRAHGLDAATLPGGLAASWEAGALVARLRQHGVEVVDLPCWEFGASGPLDGDDFRTIVADTVAAIRAAGRLDGVAVLGHGAGRTSDDLDPDATYLEALRATVGAQVPIAVVLDFHANLSARMCASADVLVGYRTNPHVDIADRLVEVADLLHRMLSGERPVSARAVAPMVLPQIAQLTTDGEPMGELRQEAARVPQQQLSVWSMSVFGGFSLTDSPDAGLSVYAVGSVRSEVVSATEAVAAHAWRLRDRYRMHATPLPLAVIEAQRAATGGRPPVLLADVADNPGGGAPGNATFVLAALADAGVDDVVMGLHCDAQVVDAAWSAGVGATIEVEFNAGSDRPFARPFRCRATVLTLVDHALVPTKGVYEGSHRHTGRCCALLLHVCGECGIRIGVSSLKVQCADDDTLRHVGLDPSAARVVVVKSRGHFRAGFHHLFTDEQIIEVGAPGVATSNLHELEWQHLPRPVLPLDVVHHFVPAAESFGPVSV